jgi:VWFA-related protein
MRKLLDEGIGEEDSRLRCLLACGLLVLVLCSGSGASAQAEQRDDVPNFRASTTLVQLDVVVTDGSGRALTTLQADDFEVKQDGRRQTVRFAEFVPRGSRLGTRTPQYPLTNPVANPLVTPVAIDESAGRHVVVFVDDRYMDFDSVVRSREALSALIANPLWEGDRLAIVGTNAAPTASLQFTRSPDVLAAQVEQLRWDPTSLRQLMDRDLMYAVCSDSELSNTLDSSVFRFGTLSTMASVLEQIRSLPGRKVLLLLADRIRSCPGDNFAFQERLRRISDIANRSSVVIYAIHTTPFSTGVAMPQVRATEQDVRGISTSLHPARFANIVSPAMVTLSQRTGGFAKRSNDISKMIANALNDAGGYYLLAYDPPDGTFSTDKLSYRKISVKVRTRKDASVRARAGFYSVPDEKLLRIQ